MLWAVSLRVSKAAPHLRYQHLKISSFDRSYSSVSEAFAVSRLPNVNSRALSMSKFCWLSEALNYQTYISTSMIRPLHLLGQRRVRFQSHRVPTLNFCLFRSLNDIHSYCLIQIIKYVYILIRNQVSHS